MCTFLHHSDPSIPHYRKAEWTYVRGVLATVDRPLLGWIGRFFFHNVSALNKNFDQRILKRFQVSHDHVAHHLFPTAPFCKQDFVSEPPTSSKDTHSRQPAPNHRRYQGGPQGRLQL